MKTLIQKLYSKIEAYFVSRWWERKINQEIDDAYKESGVFCDLHITKDHRLAIGFETLSSESITQNSIQIYESDLGRIAYIPNPAVKEQNNG